MPKIPIPTPWRPGAANQSEIELAGNTVGELLGALTEAHAELRRHLYTNQGKLCSFVNVYVNGENIRHLDREAAGVRRRLPGRLFAPGGHSMLRSEPGLPWYFCRPCRDRSRHPLSGGGYGTCPTRNNRRLFEP